MSEGLPPGWTWSGTTPLTVLDLGPVTPRENPCRVYWGSHGCDLERGHEGAHDCGCCECGENHPDAGDGVLCVATAPYYGEQTRFYGEDAEALGLPLVTD